MKIPNEWHKNSAYNCLSDEDFALLQATHEVDTELHIDDHDCECESFFLDPDHRCSCGNRRCCVLCDEFNREKFFFVEVW